MTLCPLCGTPVPHPLCPSCGAKLSGAPGTPTKLALLGLLLIGCGDRAPELPHRSEVLQENTQVAVALYGLPAVPEVPEPALVVDSDGDGHDSNVDCDDANAAIYPGAPEKKDDGIDSNCDGSDNT